MADPITIGILAASALSTAADAVLKSAVGEVVKDAYKALKGKIAHWAGRDLEALESEPHSSARQGVLAEIIDRLPQEDQTEIDVLTHKLMESLKNSNDIGIDVSHLEAMEVDLGNIRVNRGIGTRFKDVKLSGSFRVKDIDVGEVSRKIPVKENTPPPASAISVQLNDSVVHGDVILSQVLSSKGSSVDELCALLEHRAARVRDRLSRGFDSGLASKFGKLHSEHLAALRQGQLILAHDILSEIHQTISGFIDMSMYLVAPPPINYAREYPGTSGKKSAQGIAEAYSRLVTAMKKDTKGASRPIP